ncbi:hypothetical protein MJO28_002202 [Puccinia striiformis f. sp. tritici]|uniref:CHY-type domain-containing protein n=5 Tax=Puccinia striiformis TaxID=27350 RepID=A0A0L0W3D5_9BASI|nr:hypothetical protein Pst134EB_003698 [Puccinia striiformis f. sp. tritici]KAI7961713.1 hypothetical protein MJO28_002202 [Puccinia striiformis f. sp. tritici]KNF06021.1 hypothetical protein PSTG_01014 [Puccinia striiformis f. sp. tritici PST-78]POW01660.1 hypothetical protein PSTT_12336 [Puccinia striiformis]POW12215.1 hypothetical protein PSHT_08153 [Puccinia striiformis]
MCKHILNAQVSIRAQCCRKWFDCAECHVEQEPDHKLFKSTEMVMMCKKCKKPFRKIVEEFEESDEYCPHCDNHYILEAKTPKPILGIETEDSRVDNRGLSTRDHRDHKVNLHADLEKLLEDEFSSKIDSNNQ